MSSFFPRFFPRHPTKFFAASMTTATVAAAAVSAPIVVVSIPSDSSMTTTSTIKEDATKLSHHRAGGGYVNPWKSFIDAGMGPSTLFNIWRDWSSKPVPPLSQLPPFVDRVTWGIEKEEWKDKIKATWLGHACFLVEFPATEGKERGPRVLFDPVFSNRCSPSQWIGPARVTKPPIDLSELPPLDAVVISHNHYDHLDINSIKQIYQSQTPGSIHFFAPMGNKSWFKSNIGTKDDEMTELDWWGERELSIELGGKKEKLRVVCTPCQHFTGRGIHDRNHTLWASWAVVAARGRVWFAGDTGYRAVPRGAQTEEGLPTCPAFKEIGTRFGGFDLSMIPIGAYSPRWMMSRVHASPEDAVDIHCDVKSRKSIPMHFGTFVLTDEDMTEPPKRLRAECEKRGITIEQFSVNAFGETIVAEPTSRCEQLDS